MNKTDKATVLIIYTGGTIGMKESSESGALVPMKFEQLTEEIPELKKMGIHMDSFAFNPPIDSSNVNLDLWGKLASLIKEKYMEYDGFVILHGTDTMSYTASALSFMLENLGKPVILTGSQLPIGVLRTDGKENLITAIEIAAKKNNETPIVQEVCVYFSSRLFRGNRTTKEDSEQFSAFASHNFPRLAKAGTDIVFNHDLLYHSKNKGIFKINRSLCNDIAVITLFPGIQEKAFKQILTTPDLKGVVLQTFGSGNIPTTPWLTNAIQEASNKGIIFLNVTQCSGGRVIMGQYETSCALRKAGVVSGHDITIEAAVTKLMFLLGQDLEVKEIKMHLDQNMRGEICI
ncbi:type I asparaginase [Halosquirtibacter laminarini]|uniref:Type I asparaginase n=1 Tax=Halosquirtibacter laminarini TaxID=3374600 RepID=A0AC61NFB7_9BACT|nr:type I asparaginase [Prolixibacteraceae bacterium]